MLELEIIFKNLIDEIKDLKHDVKQTIIFGQTRKQCSVIYRMFCLAFGNDLYAHGRQDPTMRIIDMFHAGSPNSVKEHSIHEMGHFDSHLTVIICTIAFGMGIDCKDTCRSIYFGPPKTVELLVQESGRIGSDGKQCISYVLHNGLLRSHCDFNMKHLMRTEQCRREYITSLFSAGDDKVRERNCMCCDSCALLCQCNNHVQTMEFGKNASPSQNHPAKTRPVSNVRRQELHQKLVSYRKTLIPQSVKEFVPVGHPMCFLNFATFK